MPSSFSENTAVIDVGLVGLVGGFVFVRTSSVGFRTEFGLLTILIMYHTADEESLSSSLLAAVFEISMRMLLFVVCFQTGHVLVLLVVLYSYAPLNIVSARVNPDTLINACFGPGAQ